MIFEISDNDGYSGRLRSYYISSLVTKLTFLAICLGYLSPVWADSMRCGTRLLSDGKTPGATMAEVLQKCGEPYSTYRNNWLYFKGNSVYRVYFNNSSFGVQSQQVDIDN